MRRKYKITGCARFFIFLLIFTPIVLIGVSLYNGNNPIDQVKDLLNIETTEKTINNSSSESNANTSNGVSAEAILNSTIESQKKEIESLKTELKDLKKKVDNQNQEIQYLKQQLGNE